MKNQYFGDLRDFAKYGILRAIQSSTAAAGVFAGAAGIYLLFASVIGTFIS